MPYLRLIGPISSRTSFVTAWSETARLTPIPSPARAIIGTTPLDRKRVVSGKRVSVRVDLGFLLILNKNIITLHATFYNIRFVLPTRLYLEFLQYYLNLMIR